jgi:hypothetical protein
MTTENYCLVKRDPEIKTLYNRLKRSAQKRNIEFTLSITDLYDLSFPITCPVLGMPMTFNRGRPQDNSYSVDRIDSSIGYTIDNIRVISFRANRLKSDATQSEITKLADYVIVG